MGRICVLGLGYIGLPTVVTLVEAGFTVVGVDINEAVVRSLSEGRLPMDEPGLHDAFIAARETGRLSFARNAPSGETFIITVQTPYIKKTDGTVQADLSFVEAAARSVGRVLRPGNLVVLESTVPPGTCRWMEGILAETAGLSPDDFHTAHCPERVIPGSILKELRHNDRIIGARNRTAAERARDIYGRVAIAGSLRLTDDITAELCKLVENTHRDINIAFANELSVVSQRLGVNVFELIELANCHPRVNILQPGVGVGGHCIAVDPWFIHALMPEVTPLIEAARRVNDAKPRFVAETIAERLPSGTQVCVLGLAYKPDVGDLRESPALVLCGHLRDAGFVVSVCEPHVGLGDVGGYPNLDLDSALARDFLVLAVGHTLFKDSCARIAARPHYDCVGLLKGEVF